MTRRALALLALLPLHLAGLARAAEPPGASSEDDVERLTCPQAWEVVDLAVARHVVHDRLTPALVARARDLLVERLVAAAPWLTAGDVARLHAQAAATTPEALLAERRAGRCDHLAAQVAVVERSLGDGPTMRRFLEGVALAEARAVQADAPWAEARAFGDRRALARVERARAGLRDADALLVNAFAAALDPHSRYVTAAGYRRWLAESHPPPGLLGLVLSRPVPGGARVEEVMAGSPLAETRAVAPGDVLVSVDGHPVADLDVDDALALVSAAASPVRLGVARRAGGQLGPTQEVMVSRRVLPSRSSAVAASSRRVEGRRVRVAAVTSLDEGTSLDVERALAGPGDPADPADAVVLDLRGCTGGFVDEAVAVAGLFLDGGALVRTRQRGGQTQELEDPTAGHLYGGPLVVLVDEETASGCELIAGALHARGRAVVAGAPRTYGKGSVQAVLADEVAAGALIVTTALYFLPDGRSPQAAGIPVDLVLGAEPPDAEREAGLPFVIAQPEPLAPWQPPPDQAATALRRALPALVVLASVAPPDAHRPPGDRPALREDVVLARAAAAAVRLATLGSAP